MKGEYSLRECICPGYQYNVSKSSVVTLTRCIGNEVITMKWNG